MGKVISTNQAPEAIGPYSQAYQVGDLLFTSGQIPLKPDGQLLEGNIEEQTHQVFRNLIAVLEAAGATLQNVVKTTIFIKNMDDFAKINEVYASYFEDHRPARSTVEVARLPKDVDIEIDMVVDLS